MVERWISGYGMDLVGDRLNSAGVNCTKKTLAGGLWSVLL